MGHAIPKIEYKNETQSADRTNTSDTLISIISTDLIEIGMLAEGAGIPAGATVIAKTSSTVQLSAPVTSTGSNDVNFLYRISFDFPPIEETGELIDPKERQAVSLSGVVQTSIDFVEAKRNLTFSFLSPAVFNLLKNFYLNHAYIGEPFRYYDDKTLTNYLTYELGDLRWNPKKGPSRGTDYLWVVPLRFRRVLS